MTETSKRIIRDSIRRSMGDDLERANRAFGAMPADQLKTEWGQSGKTVQEIWDEYKRDRSERTAALAEFEAMVSP